MSEWFSKYPNSPNYFIRLLMPDTVQRTPKFMIILGLITLHREHWLNFARFGTSYR